MGPYYDHQVGQYLPPDPYDDQELIHRRVRQVRAEVTADLLRALRVRLTVAAHAVLAFIRCAGAGAALMPPRGDVRHRQARLTSGCH